MNLQILRRSYDRFASGYDEAFQAQQTPKIVSLLAALPDPPPTPWLDVGAGTGLVARLSGGAPICLDLSRGMVARAPAPRVQADLHALPFPAGALRCVTAVTALIDLSTPATALAELVRVLAPGGWLAVTALVRENPEAFAAALRRLPLTPFVRLSLGNDVGFVARRLPLRDGERPAVTGDPPV